MENHTSDSLLEALWGCDSSVIEKRMSLEESTRLFEKDVDRVEIWQFPNRATNCTTTIEQISPFRIFTINGLGMLQQFWQVGVQAAVWSYPILMPLGRMRHVQNKTLSSRYPFSWQKIERGLFYFFYLYGLNEHFKS